MPELHDLLVKTSRTFALSIPLLPSPTDREVTIAYLLFRIADTFEDAVHWGIGRSQEALRDLGRLLTDGTGDAEALARGWLEDPPPHDHEGYRELLRETPFVLAAYRDLGPRAREILREHLLRTIDGMTGVVGSRDGDRLELEDLDDLRRYCYLVAGIVGEMLTEIFLLREELHSVGDDLRARSALFGEGLQLVNILKDSSRDAEEGRIYLPPELSRETVMALAREDLDTAAEYTRILQRSRAPRGLVAFNALPVILARQSLDRVERDGPGAKLTRPEVFAAIEKMNTALDTGVPVV